MCLSIPARILERDGSRGTVDFDGLRSTVNLSMVPAANPGDYVLIHAGMAIQVYDAAEAEETLQLLREVRAASAPARPDA